MNDRNWRNLLTDIEARQVIPVIGPELLVLDNEPGQPTLYEYLARQLVSRLSIDEQKLPPDYGLVDVTNVFLQEPRNLPEDLHYETREILTARLWPTPEPLRKLAAITSFDLFVSTTFDSLLEQSVNETEPAREGVLTIANAEKRPVENDLPVGFESSSSRAVFQLFGRLNAIGDYGVTEDKILEFSHRLPSLDQRLPNLFATLRARKLLTLGCGLPSWLVRFFLRAIKGEQLFAQGVRGLIADRESRTDRAFVMFLERRQTEIYAAGDAVDFVNELHRRWMERSRQRVSPTAPVPEPPRSQPSSFQDDSVFISYASDDRAYALQVKKAFDDGGVDAWFDQSDLQSGDDFRLKIEQSIESCTFFVPLISKHTATSGKRFFWREWNKAIEEAKSYPPAYPFIQPILLDDTPLPVEFANRHYRRIDQLPQLIDEARKRIRERRLQKRPA